LEERSKNQEKRYSFPKYKTAVISTNRVMACVIGWGEILYALQLLHTTHYRIAYKISLSPQRPLPRPALSKWHFFTIITKREINAQI